MYISTRVIDFTKHKADLLVVSVFSREKKLLEPALSLDKAMDGALTRAMAQDHFEGKLGETLLLRAENRLAGARVLVVGLGKREECDEEVVRCFAAVAWTAAENIHAARVASALPGGSGVPEAQACGKAMTEGMRLCAYGFRKYKKAEKRYVTSFEISPNAPSDLRCLQAGVELGERHAKGANMARDLANTPGEHMRPVDLVDAARAIVKAQKGMRMRVYGRAVLKKMGAGGILGIAQGSDHEPFLVHIIYRGSRGAGGKTKKIKRIALVGKAVTFDSGGLSLKPWEAMLSMKADMAGAAAVLGVFSVLAEEQPNVEVHGIFGACENMVSARSIRPGDVVRIMNGKTMEILNTDAEGRVTLADTLTYAVRQKPDAIIDVATLTGACMVALGEEITGLMSNNPALAQKMLVAAKVAGEKMWELPLEKRYKNQIKSEVADYKNTADRYGGALTAGLLLEEFVEGKPWVHLDIAGPFYAEKPLNAYTKKGATGHGVRTLLEFLRGYK